MPLSRRHARVTFIVSLSEMAAIFTVSMLIGIDISLAVIAKMQGVI